MEANLSTLILSIAHSARISMGDDPQSENKSHTKNKSMAQFNIDLLVVLKEKTQNNLSTAEEQLLSAIINDLQMSFVNIQFPVDK